MSELKAHRAATRLTRAEFNEVLNTFNRLGKNECVYLDSEDGTRTVRVEVSSFENATPISVEVKVPGVTRLNLYPSVDYFIAGYPELFDKNV